MVESCVETYDLIKKREIEGETERLRSQVTLGWSLERKKLEQLGLDNELVFLDLGCGPGAFSELVGDAFPKWKVVGVDNNCDLLPKSSTYANVTFISSEKGGVIPLSSMSVDVVYCRFLFQHLIDRARVLAEISRVLRPGGLVMVVDVDDRGVIFSPEQEWIRNIYIGVESVQESLNGDRFVGAALPQIFTSAGFEPIAFEVIPMTNFLAPSKVLLDLAFGLKRRFLEAKTETAYLITRLDNDIESFLSIPGHVIYIPIFFCVARYPVSSVDDNKQT